MSFAAGIHFAANGTAFAVCDGPELLVYGGDGSPRWKHFCEDVLVGVRVTPSGVITVDASGNLTRFRPHDGMVQDTVRIDGGAVGMDVSAQGVVLVQGAEDITLVQGTSTRPLGVGGTSAAAFGPDAGSIGMGWSNGTFRAMDANTGAAWGEIPLGAAITAVAWSPRGSWVVGAGPQLFVISGDGQQVLATLPLDEPCRAVAAAGDGVLVAAMVGEMQVAFGELHTNKTAGFALFRREVHGISWGPAGRLAIGLDDGDGSVIDALAGGSIRTEPHPGRGRNTWNFEDKIAKDDLRGAAAYSIAGGAPIAKYEGYEPEGWKWYQIVGIILAIFTVICMGCTGCGGLLWYLRFMNLI